MLFLKITVLLFLGMKKMHEHEFNHAQKKVDLARFLKNKAAIRSAMAQKEEAKQGGAEDDVLAELENVIIDLKVFFVFVL